MIAEVSCSFLIGSFSAGAYPRPFSVRTWSRIGPAPGDAAYSATWRRAWAVFDADGARLLQRLRETQQELLPSPR